MLTNVYTDGTEANTQNTRPQILVYDRKHVNNTRITSGSTIFIS